MGNGTPHRITELDYLKGIMILLMISFHLVYIGDSYPYAKRVVYTFHMPIFLLISGYLLNSSKPARQFLKTMFWYAVPYVIMESGYTLMASLLPIREHIDHLTPAVFLDKLLLHPLGPYWYLHTLIICGTTYYIVRRLLSKASIVSQLVLTGVLYALYARLGIVSLPASLFFLAGVTVRQSGLSFLQVFRASAVALVPLVLLIVYPENLESHSVGSVLIVYLVISLFLAVKPLLSGVVSRTLIFLGRNTLCLFLFSPLFTLLCKPLVSLFSFDPTALLFLVTSLTVCTVGCLLVSYLTDICRLSPFIFGRDKITAPYPDLP